MRRPTLVSFLAFLGITFPAQAQQLPVVEIDGLVITGTSVPRPLIAMGSNVSVVDGDDLRARERFGECGERADVTEQYAHVVGAAARLGIEACLDLLGDLG